MTIGMKYMSARLSIIIGSVMVSLSYILTAYAEHIGILYFTVGFIQGGYTQQRDSLSLQIRGYKVIKTFSCSTQLSMKFIMIINVKMPIMVGILIFISMVNTCIKHPRI